MRRSDAQDAAATRQQMLEDIAELTRKAISDMQSLYMEEGQAGRSKDADRPWVECSTRTRVSIELFKELSKNGREREATSRALGAIVLRGQVEVAAWEANAKAVEEASVEARAMLEATVVVDDPKVVAK